MIQKILICKVKFGSDSILLIDSYIKMTHFKENNKDKPKVKNITFMPVNKDYNYSRLRDSI